MNEKLEKLNQELAKGEADCGGRSTKKRYWSTR